MKKTTKSPVQLREKALKDGSKSLYLDIYSNGKRTYKFLKMYLSPGNTRAIKAKNQATLIAAQKIAADEVIRLTTNKAGIDLQVDETTLLGQLRHFADLRKQTGQSQARGEVIETVIKTVAPFHGVKLNDIDNLKMEEILEYLKSKNYKEGTVRTYYAVVVSALNCAVREGKIPRNPNVMVDTAAKPKNRISKREYLTKEELERFEAVQMTGNGYEVQRAFVFAARYTGLRMGDTFNLKWTDIKNNQINIKMMKTGEQVIIPITAKTMEFLGKKEGEYLFDNARTVTKSLAWHYCRQITRKAGIDKPVSFHTSRHTFAVALLTAGVDIYTVSKLLGHTSIKTTEIYADIVDSRKRNAMDLLNDYLNS